LLEVMLKCVNDGVTTIKPGHQTSGNAWPCQMGRRLRTCSLRQEQFMIGGTLTPACLVTTEKHCTWDIMWWLGQQYCGLLLVPLLVSFMAELLQGSAWTTGISGASHDPERHLRTMQFSKTTVPPLTQLEVFSHGSKSVSIFPGKNSNQASTSLYHSGQFWRLG
jgi:hypothetical protein